MAEPNCKLWFDSKVCTLSHYLELPLGLSSFTPPDEWSRSPDGLCVVCEMSHSTWLSQSLSGWLQRNTHLMSPPSLSSTQSLETWGPSLFYPSLLRRPRAGGCSTNFSSKRGKQLCIYVKARTALSVLGKISSQARLVTFCLRWIFRSQIHP